MITRYSGQNSDPTLPGFVSQSAYAAIMDQCEYLPEQKLWTIPGLCFKGVEPDYPMLFSSRYDAHNYVWSYLANE